MTTQVKKERSDYRAGVFLSLSLIFLLAITFGSMEYTKNTPAGPEYTISVPIEMGVGGIDSSSRLIYGGLTVGHVRSVEYQREAMLVKVVLNRPIDLHQSVKVIKEASLLGGTTNLLIIDTGATHKSSPLGKGDVIKIAQGASGVSSILGKKGADSIDSITDNLEETSIGLRGISESLQKNEDIESIRANYEALAASMQKDLPEWESGFQSTIDRIDRISSKGEQWSSQFESAQKGARTVADSLSEIIERLDDEQRAKLVKAFDGLMKSAAETRADLDENVIPLVEELIQTAQQSWDDLLGVGEDMKSIAADAKYSIDYALAQTNLAAQQLTLTVSDVIGALGLPLLERPSRPEIELIAQNAAFSEWARSATQMREILDAIDQMPVSREGQAISEAGTMARLVDLLRASLADYEASQARYEELKVLQSPGSKRPDGVDDQDQ